MSKIKIEDIREELAKFDWQVISQKYENLDTEMEFLCSEGHNVHMTWKKLRNRIQCPICNQNQFKDQSNEIIPKPRGVKRVLGLDQATKISGYSIYENGKLIKYGVYQADGFNTIDRDANIRNWLVSIIKNWQIDFVCLEGIQLQNNLEGGQKMGVTTFEALARLQGMLMITLYDLKIDYDIVHTAIWRQYCGVKGKSRADKKMSMRRLAKEWYDVTVTEDEADAIGIGKYAAEKISKAQEIIMWD